MLEQLRLAGALAIAVAIAPVSQVYAQEHTAHSKASELTSADQFMPHLLESNAAEVEFGRIGAIRAENVRVREFARMIATAHLETLENLGGLAHTGRGTPKKVSYKVSSRREKPFDMKRSDFSAALSREHLQIRDRLNRLSGAEFDREFMNVMVSTHQKTAEFLQTHLSAFTETHGATTSMTPASVRSAFALLCRTLLPVVQNHLQQARTLEREMHTSAGKR